MEEPAADAMWLYSTAALLHAQLWMPGKIVRGQFIVRHKTHNAL